METTLRGTVRGRWLAHSILGGVGKMGFDGDRYLGAYEPGDFKSDGIWVTDAAL